MYGVATENLTQGDVGVGLVIVPIQNLNADVLMMQPAEDWNRHDGADLLRPSQIGCIFVQREMGSDFVVIRGVCLQDIAQVRFTEHHEVVQ